MADLAVYPIAPAADRRAVVGKFAATQQVHMAAQNPAQADRRLAPKLLMPAQRTHPLLVAVVVVDMPAAIRTAVENPNR